MTVRPLLPIVVLVAIVGAGIHVTRQSMVDVSPGPGVSQELAADRARRVSDVRYDVHLRIPADRGEPIRGTIAATFQLGGTARGLAFDFAQPAERLLSSTANGRPFTATPRDGHILVPADVLQSGPNTVTFEFLAGDGPLNRQDDLVYSLFVPARASSAFPCLDQPDLKARWTLALDVPASWKTVSNGRETGRTLADGTARYLFAETVPLPTYLFAFAAGRFEVETAARGGRTFRMFHRESDPARVARNRDSIFDQHERALAWMEDYAALPYPFGKFDIVLLPAFQFSGMEHPGAVYYNAASLLLDAAATQTQELTRAQVIAHETAHMWFGDLVTMTWFDDVWMKEVFANFLAARMVNPSFPGVNHDLRFLVQHHPAAYEVDRTDGANPIRQPLANLSDAGSLYGAIIYQKAPIVFRQLELLMGADALRDGLRSWLRAHAFANASWRDLVQVLDAATPHDLSAWSHAWIEESGRPTLSVDVGIQDGTISRLVLRQSDSRGRDLVWPQHLRVLVGGSGGDIRTFEVTIDGANQEVPGAVGLPKPAWILPLGGGLGYGDVDLDADTMSFLTRALHTIHDPATRAAAAIARWEAMLDDQIAPEAVFDALLLDLPAERDELTLQLLLDQTRTAFWRFTPAAARDEAAARLEPVLRRGLGEAATTSRKAAWFTALRHVAWSAETVAWLESVWARHTRVDGLPLAEADETELALDVALRSGARGDAIVAAQLARVTDPDRRARLTFIAPAVSGDSRARTEFFVSLRDVSRRAREAWVVDAARYLHHPWRSGESRELVLPALDLLLEIRRTGDIFFPKRWADATLSGYREPELAARVREFVDRLPGDYPPRLRWVLLSSADPLFRAASLLDR